MGVMVSSLGSGRRASRWTSSSLPLNGLGLSHPNAALALFHARAMRRLVLRRMRSQVAQDMVQTLSIAGCVRMHYR